MRPGWMWRLWDITCTRSCYKLGSRLKSWIISSNYPQWVCHPFLPRANLSLPKGKKLWSEINLLGFASAIPIHDPLTQYCGKRAKWKVFGYGVASQTPKQGRIYGRKHCPTPANLQHLSGTPPAILDFLLYIHPVDVRITWLSGS